jgi:glycosyltransferase involved in cell wall biosynthesis
MNKNAIIENGIDKKNIETFFKRVEKKDNIIELIYLGGVRYKKGPDILLKALAILVHKYKQNYIRLNVLREIPFNSLFIKLAKDLNVLKNINLVGYIPAPNHLEYINKSDIFVLPSRTEGIANTLMEAIGLEKPIVATKVGGTPELVIDNENGLLCSVDPNDLADKLYVLIKSEKMREKFSLKNKNLKNKYYWDNIIKKYEKLYEEI